MFVGIFVIGLSLHSFAVGGISSESGVDEIFADDNSLSSFDENVAFPLQNPDSIVAVSIPDANFNGNGNGDSNGANSDGLFDSVLDTNSDLFADDDLDLMGGDSTLIADCNPPTTQFQDRKARARLRRGDSCPNSLDLPTLNEANIKPENPYRPETKAELDRLDTLNIWTANVNLHKHLLDSFLKSCMEFHKVGASSNNPEDIRSDGGGSLSVFNGRDRTF